MSISREPFMVPGFKVSAAASSMRYRNRDDLTLVVAEADEGAVASGVFTQNRFCAAPVEYCKSRLQEKSRFRAVLVNAGIANACTGEEGLNRAGESARITAQALDVQPDSVLVASTGVIGQQMKLEPVAKAMPDLVQGLDAEKWEKAARAIMTTDTVPKMASTTVQLGEITVTVGGIAKGSGMIAPNMATLLAFVFTDAAIDPKALDHWVRAGADRSFNAITVDGDTSTNDTLLVLASGKAGNAPLSEIESEESRTFGKALEAVLLDLAKQVVTDGEGATKFIEISVTGAPDAANAKTVALTIANSPLVKTAFFGGDANWGRIVCAAGRAGVALDPARVALFFGDVCVFRNGTPLEGPEIEKKASAVFRQKEIQVRLDLGMGKAQFTAYTCDFSYDYVKINADYRT